jgi:tight adherence protein C
VQILVPLLVFLAVGALAFVLLALIFSEERKVARALRNVSVWESQQAGEAEPLLRPFHARVVSPITGAIGASLGGLLPSNSRARMQHTLDLAGNPGGVAPEGVLALSIASAIACPVVAAGIVLLLRGGFTALSVVFILAAAVGGYLVPTFWIDELKRKRQDQIRLALPDMLDMLTISVQAGLGFDMALTKLVRNTSGPLAQEFAHMLAEVQAGVSRRDGLRHLGERTDVPELGNFIMAMIQAEVFGVSVSGILRSQAVELRKKRQQRAEELGQKAPVKMVFPIILCMLPATMLVILGPAVISVGRAFGIVP